MVVRIFIITVGKDEPDEIIPLATGISKSAKDVA